MNCPAKLGTTFSFPPLEPTFTAVYNMVRDYNLGWARCNADEDDPWFHRFPLVTYLRNITPPTQYTDELHMEVLQPDMQWAQYEMRCLVTLNPSEQELTKYGLDLKLDILLYPCLPLLEDLGLAVQAPGELYVGPRKVVPNETDYNNGPIRFLCAPGDRAWVYGQLFEIQHVYPWNYLGNTNIPLYLVMAANRYRPDTPEVELGRTV